MKTRFQIVSTVLFLAISTSAQALSFELDRPGLSSSGVSIESFNQIQRVLERADCKFLGGLAVNWHTTLRYQSSTKALSSFLNELSACEGTVIKISFVESIPKETGWHVLHSGGSEFDVQINIASKEFNLVDLVLPEIRGRAGAEQNEERQPAIF